MRYLESNNICIIFLRHLKVTHTINNGYNELLTLKLSLCTLWPPTGCVISPNIITCENRKYVGSFRVFVCLSVRVRDRGHSFNLIIFKFVHIVGNANPSTPFDNEQNLDQNLDAGIFFHFL